MRRRTAAARPWRQDATDGFYIGGVEWAWVNGWIVAVEYPHYDFGKKPEASTGTAVPVRFDPSADTVRARVSYKFGDWGKGPVSAKY